MKLAFIGIGNVGFALANTLQNKGHRIIIAHDDLESESVLAAIGKNPSFAVLPIQEAINESDIVFLAIPFKLNEDILRPLDFYGKILIDCTNPVGAGITHGLESKISGAEKVQQWAKNAIVVKSYSIYGHEILSDSKFLKKEINPVMLIAGNNLEAKQKVSTLNDDLGFDTLDVGDLSQSLHLEHMTLLWVKMVRANGHPPNFTWAFLER